MLAIQAAESQLIWHADRRSYMVNSGIHVLGGVPLNP